MRYESASIQPVSSANELVLGHNNSGKNDSVCLDRPNQESSNGANEVDE